MNTMSSLVSMQSALKYTGAVKSAQNELRSEASIYKPSFAFQGDPETADALTSKADNLNGSVGKIVSRVQNQIQNTTDKSDKADKSDAANSAEQTNSDKAASDTAGASEGTISDAQQKTFIITESTVIGAHFNVLV